MKATEIYNRFLLKSDKNSVNESLSVDRGRFVELYNEHQYRFVEYIYNKKGDDDLRNIQTLLVESVPLSRTFKDKDSVVFELPSDYFEFSNVYGLGSKGSCTNAKIDLFEIKDMDRNLILLDEFTSPSFEYREAPFIISNNSIKVFTDDFSIDNIVLSYYRYPKPVRLLFPNNPESELDDSYDLDFDEKIINRIVSMAVSGFDVNNMSERWQLHSAVSKTDF